MPTCRRTKKRLIVHHMQLDCDLGPHSPLAARVAKGLAGYRRLGVAFSGGVDSSVLLALAARSLGPPQVVALLGVSASLAVDERRAAHEIARFIGVTLAEVPTRELDDPAYRSNGPDRCYHCKSELFARIDADLAPSFDLDAIAYGENADDVRRLDRPGSRAATERGVLSPLAEAGATKDDVRQMARLFGLLCADKPAAPCLASRIPHHEDVTREKLRQVDAAESLLRGLGFTDCRVRHHGATARVELPVSEIPRATSEPLYSAIISGVEQVGFDLVTVDVNGIQSGAFTLTEIARAHG